MPERRLGPYRLIRHIATGGMAEVHLAKARAPGGFEKSLALKLLHPNLSQDPELIGMLVEEAKIAVRLTHGNIVQIFDLGQIDDTYFIAMEYVDGPDLFRLLQHTSTHNQAFPIELGVHVAREILNGLDYAHRKTDEAGRRLGIIHRDVSPQNVLVSRAGEVKLIDFGIAKAAQRVERTRTGVIKGKYNYMSPEQASGGSVDARSDLFSCGILLYEMLVGQMVYLEENLLELVPRVREAKIPPPRTLRKEIPEALERLVMRALSREREARFASADEFRSSLEQFLVGHTLQVSPTELGRFVRHTLAPGQKRDDFSREDSFTVDDYPSGSHSMLARIPYAPKKRDRPRTRDSLPKSSAALAPPAGRSRSRPWRWGLVGAALLVILSGALLAHRLASTVRRGHITILSVPPGAAVVLDGQRLARPTPAIVNDVSTAEPHRVELVLPGYRTKVHHADFEPGQSETQVVAVLDADFGTVSISSEPPGAEVFLNGRAVGPSPVVVRDVRRSEALQLEVRLRSNRSYRETIAWGKALVIGRNVVFSHASRR